MSLCGSNRNPSRVPLSPLIGESYQACFNIQDASLAGWTMLKDMQVDNGTKGRIVESLVIHHLVSEKICQSMFGVY
jgi:hypothetical protein